MRNINFNIGSDKKLNYVRIIIIGLFTIFISTFFIKAGINNIIFLNSKTTEKQLQINKLNDYIDKISKNEPKMLNEIKTNRSKWEPRIKFINSLIHKKTFPYLKRLDILENLIPNEAYLRNISIKYGSKNRVILNIESNSYQTLLEIYKVFGKLDLKFGKESKKDGKYLNTMTVVMQDE